MIGFPYFAPAGPRVPNLQQVPTITLPASSVTQTIPFVVTGGPVVLVGLGAQSVANAAPGNFTSRIYLTWEQNYCDTGPVNADQLWGNANNVTWVRPKYIPNQSTINLELTNLTTGFMNAVDLTLYLHNSMPGDDALYGRGKGFMVYVLPFGAGMTIPGGKSLQFNQRIEDWADFSPDVQNADATSEAFTMQMSFRDTRADYSYNLSNVRMPSVTLFGNSGGEPFQYPQNGQPIFRRASNLLFDGFDLSGSSNTVTPMLLGQRLT